MACTKEKSRRYCLAEMPEKQNFANCFSPSEFTLQLYQKRKIAITVCFRPINAVCLQMFLRGGFSSGDVPKYVHKQNISDSNFSGFKDCFVLKFGKDLPTTIGMVIQWSNLTSERFENPKKAKICT